MLGPVLEQLAEEQKDKWELVKVNTEEQQELARQYGIRSIPNVKLFHKGEVIGEFAGALPKFQLEQWLKSNLPDPSSSELDSILKSASNVSKEELFRQLRQFVAQHPTNQEAKLALGQLLVFNHAEEVEHTLKGIKPGDALFDSAEDIRNLARLMLFELENGSEVSSLLSGAKTALYQDNPEIAIQKIIEAAFADKHFRDDLPRKAAIALFHIWGNDHDLTRKYRRKFDMALY
jgi:putative thioredoxin